MAGLDTALYCTLYHCQLIYGDVIPNEIYKNLDINYVLPPATYIPAKNFCELS
jgi:hypothetical protein